MARRLDTAAADARRMVDGWTAGMPRRRESGGTGFRTINETSREGRETILLLCFCWPFILASAEAGQGPPTPYWELMLLFLINFEDLVLLHLLPEDVNKMSGGSRPCAVLEAATPLVVRCPRARWPSLQNKIRTLSKFLVAMAFILKSPH
nr:uncharacterized protein LOC127338110 [Lolium perenne]